MPSSLLSGSKLRGQRSWGLFFQTHLQQKIEPPLEYAASSTWFGKLWPLVLTVGYVAWNLAWLIVSIADFFSDGSSVDELRTENWDRKQQ